MGREGHMTLEDLDNICFDAMKNAEIPPEYSGLIARETYLKWVQILAMAKTVAKSGGWKIQITTSGRE